MQLKPYVNSHEIVIGGKKYISKTESVKFKTIDGHSVIKEYIGVDNISIIVHILHEYANNSLVSIGYLFTNNENILSNHRVGASASYTLRLEKVGAEYIQDSDQFVTSRQWFIHSVFHKLLGICQYDNCSNQTKISINYNDKGIDMNTYNTTTSFLVHTPLRLALDSFYEEEDNFDEYLSEQMNKPV